jgi:hypothetical protein
MRKSVFVHLPKTAGSSFNAAARKNLGRQALSPDSLASHLSKADAARLERFTMITGHISMADVKVHFPDRMILTILREPVDRCVSWYYFSRKGNVPAFAAHYAAAKNNSIEDYFALDYKVTYRHIFNRQVRQLGAHVLNEDVDLDRALENAKETLRAAVWVGRQEHLAADLERLGQRVPELANLSLPSVYANKDRKPRDELAPGLVRRIRALNEYDTELYEFASREICAST